MATTKSELKPVNFTVEAIGPHENPIWVSMDIKFDGKDHAENYHPRWYTDSTCKFVDGYTEFFGRVAGCKVYFLKNGPDLYQVTRIERYENWSGQRRRNYGGKVRGKQQKQQPEQQPNPEQQPEQQKQQKQQPKPEQKRQQREKFRKAIEERKQREGKGQGQRPQGEPEPKPEPMPEPEPEPKDEWDMPDTDWRGLADAALDSGLAVYLAGPAGCGKSYAVQDICTERDWEFYSTNAVTQEYKLLGFIDAMGDYQDTQLYQACVSEEECVFFLDEMDASDAQALVVLNAAIANGYLEFPCGRVNIEHVHWIAAGNTLGNGADEIYTGRVSIDGASLDRFAYVICDYDENVELELAKGDASLVALVHELRKLVKNMGIKATYSYRCIIGITALKGKVNRKQAVQMCLVKGLDVDTFKTMRVNCGDNAWTEAWEDLRMAA